MSTRAAIVLILTGLSVEGAAIARDRPVDWRRAAIPADRTRLRRWREAWIDALAKARMGGAGAGIAAEGALLDPDAALTGATPPPGAYLCRTLRLGGENSHGFTPGGSTACTVEPDDEDAVFSSVAGPQRTTGTIYEDTGARSVFLGALMLGDETRRMRYGRDKRRNMVGVVERIGSARWRIALPYPSFQSTLDVIELVPATAAPR